MSQPSPGAEASPVLAGAPPALPTFGASTATVARLQWLRLRRSRRWILAVIAVTTVWVAVAAAAHLGEADPSAALRDGIHTGGFLLLALLLPLFLTSGAVAEEVEARTLVYLTSRPLPRAAIALGKLLATTAASALLLGAYVVALHVTILAPLPGEFARAIPETARALGALVLLTGAYGSLAMLLGSLVVEAAGITVALYFGLVELAMSFAPSVMPYVSLNFVAQRLAGLPILGSFADSIPAASPAGLVAALVVATLAFTGLAVLVLSVRELVPGRD